MFRAVIIVLFTIALVSCVTQKPEDDVPALIDKPTVASHGELVEIVSRVLNQSPVMLSHDALTRTNLLVIEIRRIQNLKGERDGRRVAQSPAQFRLVMNNSHCVLLFDTDGSRYQLKQTSCREL